PFAFLTRTPRRPTASRQQLLEGIAPPPLGIDDELASHDGRPNPAAGLKIERVQHGLGNGRHHGPSYPSKPCSVGHADHQWRRLYRNITLAVRHGKSHRSRSLGSRASRSASPNRLKPNTV